ncbi:MAG: hypothetical protein ACR2MS_07845 [Weeksellaceae bacterium]
MSKGRLQLRGFRGRRSDEWYENYFKNRHVKPIKGQEATIEVDDYHYHQEELNMPTNNSKEDRINDLLFKRWGNVLEELAKNPIGHNHDKEANEEGDREEGDAQQALQPGELPSDDDV